MSELLPPTESALRRAAAHLAAGHLVGMPTETVYGLAAHAFDPDAVARVFDAKERPHFDPLIVHVADERSLSALEAAGIVDATSFPAALRARVDALLARRWPGPLTVVLPRGPRVPDLATSGLATVGVRCPDHPLARALIRALGAPVVAPSANRFGRISPTTASAVDEELGDRVRYVLDGGPCRVGVESSVLAITGDGATLLRPGAVSAQELSADLGLPVARGVGDPSRPTAPGQTSSHYAPTTPLTVLTATLAELSDEALRAQLPPGDLGLLLLAGDPDAAAERIRRLTGARVIARALSSDGDRPTVARHLFAGLRALDASPVDALVAEPCAGDTGLSHAIADRLARASAR